MNKTCKNTLTAIFAGAALLTLAGCGSGYNSRSDFDFGRDIFGTRQEPQRIRQNLPSGVERVNYHGYEPAGTIMIDIKDHKLYFTQSDGTALAYPIAAPRRDADIPPAQSIVSEKKMNPLWTPTDEMRAKDPNLPDFVPGGPGNPLGVRALYLGNTLFRIHGTNAPNSIGTDASSGCIRMHNKHVMDLYDRVPVGTNVQVHKNAPVPGIGRTLYSQPRYRQTAPDYR